MGFGGNNGLTDFKDILGFNVQANATRSALFSASAIALALGVLITWLIVDVEVRQDPHRRARRREPHPLPRLAGGERKAVRLHACRPSMAGIAGALYVPQVGIINPGEFDPGNSIEVVVWTAVGGRGTIVGPIIGALLVNAGKSWFTGAMPELWLFALGGLFVGVTLFLPKGIRRPVGPVAWRRRRQGANARASVAAERASTSTRRRRRSCAAEVAGEWSKPMAAPSRSQRSRAMSKSAPSSISTASRSPSTVFARSTTCRWCSTRARCAPSSAPTAPARRR